MFQDKLKIITVTKTIFDKVYTSLLNCPKEHLELKKIIINELTSYLKDVYIANDISDVNKRKYWKEILLYRTKYISSLINILYNYKLINKRTYLSLGSDMELLVRLMSGWLKM